MANVLQLPSLAEVEALAGEDSEPSDATWDGAQQLLSIALALAVKDNASSVHYHVWRGVWQGVPTGEGVLAYVVGGVCYEMVPPPPEIAGALFAVARKLLLPRGLWGSLRRLLGRTAGGCSGQFSLLDAGGSRSEWCGVVWSAGTTSGLEFYRFYPAGVPATTCADGPERPGTGTREDRPCT